MKNFFTWFITGIVSIAFFMWAVAQNNEATARRYHAAAAVIREQSQARVDLAAALFPYTALVVVVVVVVITAGLVIYALGRNERTPAPTRIIETRTIILLQPGQSRRQLWRQLSQAADIHLIGGSRDDF